MSENRGKSLGFITAFSVGLVLVLWIGLVVLVVLGLRDGSLQGLWANIGDGQAQIISAALAAVGLMTSAVLVPFIFKDRIRDLDSAVAEMKGTIESFENDASAKLEMLSNALNERMAEIERRSGEDVDRIGAVLEEIRSAVILSVSDGHISDPKHARVFAQHLYNDAVTACRRRLEEKPRLWAATREQIALLRTMSSQYLSKLEEVEVLSAAERAIVDRVKFFAFKRTDFAVSDVGELNKVRSDFDKAFGDSAIGNVDSKET